MADRFITDDEEVARVLARLPRARRLQAWSDMLLFGWATVTADELAPDDVTKQGDDDA